MSNSAVIVRAERRGDETAIRALNEAAFGHLPCCVQHGRLTAVKANTPGSVKQFTL